MRVHPDVGGDMIAYATSRAPGGRSCDVVGYRQVTGIEMPPTDAMTVDVLSLRLIRARDVSGPGQDVPLVPPVKKKLMLPGGDVEVVRLPPQNDPDSRIVEPTAILLVMLTRTFPLQLESRPPAL